MKKYLILFLLIGIANSYAGPPARNLNTEKMISNFTNWLIKNDHTEFLEINKDYNEECNECNNLSSSKECFEKNGKPKKTMKGITDLKIENYFNSILSSLKSEK